jgi:hypothetical protein
MDQVIRMDGRIIRLIQANKFPDVAGCPLINIKSDGNGFYVHAHYNDMAGFHAVDVSALWFARNVPSE